MRSARERSKLSESEFREVLAKQGMSLRTLQRKIEHEFIGREYIRSRIVPLLDSRIGRQEIYEYYVEHKNEFQRLDLVEWQNVFIAVTPQRPTPAAARQFAEELIQRARKGEDFANFIQYDDGDSKFRNGLGYGQRRGEIKPPELESRLFDMAAGEIGPPFELSTGVHIYRVVRREHAGQIAFNEEIQRQIRKKLRDEMAEREYKAIIRELKARAIIEIETR
jgi:parvulin-like peptidyl-prolyl isomerase